MKKILVIVYTLLFAVCGFAKSLEGKNLEAVNMAMDSRLYVYDFEDLQEQLDCLAKVENQIAKIKNELSEEAQIICRSIILYQRETLIAADAMKDEEARKQMRAERKENKKNPNPDEDKLYQLFLEYEDFEKNHSNVSSQFKFHKLEAEFSTMSYLSTTKAMKKMKDIIESYKALADEDPDYAENLFTLASIYYSIPKVMGGDKDYAVKCVQHGIETATSNYEKASCYALYSQILFEEKKYDESRINLNKAKAIAPNNKMILRYEEMNNTGYSMFDERAYKKEK